MAHRPTKHSMSLGPMSRRPTSFQNKGTRDDRSQIQPPRDARNVAAQAAVSRVPWKKRDDVKLEESKRQDVKKRSDSGKPEAASPAKQPDVHQAEWFSQWRGVRRKESAASCTPDRREKHTEAIRLLAAAAREEARAREEASIRAARQAAASEDSFSSRRRASASLGSFASRRKPVTSSDSTRRRADRSPSSRPVESRVARSSSRRLDRRAERAPRRDSGTSRRVSLSPVRRSPSPLRTRPIFCSPARQPRSSSPPAAPPQVNEPPVSVHESCENLRSRDDPVEAKVEAASAAPVADPLPPASAHEASLGEAAAAAGEAGVEPGEIKDDEAVPVDVREDGKDRKGPHHDQAAAILASKSLYEVLSVPASATTAQITTSFRALAKQWHPDKCDVAEATIVFKALGEAYSTLRDTEKRGEYDRVSMLASASSSSSAFAAPSAPPSAATPVVPPTPDLEVLLAVTLVESFMGCVKSVPVGRNAPCGACVHKSSATATERPHCLNCGDRGSVWSIDTVVVTIEPGMNAGHCIRLARQGNQSPACAPGDVVIRLVDAFPCPASALPPKLANPQIPLTPDGVQRPEFKRVGDRDLVVECVIELEQTLNGYYKGFRFSLGHLDGRVFVVYSPPGYVPHYGAMLIVPALGLRAFPIRAAPPGNLFIRLLVATPACPSRATSDAVLGLLPLHPLPPCEHEAVSAHFC